MSVAPPVPERSLDDLAKAVAIRRDELAAAAERTGAARRNETFARNALNDAVNEFETATASLLDSVRFALR